MKYYLLAIMAVLMLLLSSCFVSSSLSYSESQTENVPNLIVNPSFNPYSLDPRTALKGWAVDYDPPESPDGKVVIDTQVAMEGKTSLRIDASDNAVILITDPFRVVRYGGYYIRAGIKGSSSDMPEITLRFITFKENGKIFNRFRKKAKPQEDWSKVSISAGFIRPGVNAGRVAIMIPPFKDGSIWIDDVGCWKVHHFRID